MLIEFAFVAPFVVLLLAVTAKLAVAFFVDTTISGAMQGVAREIRTGQIEEEVYPFDAFQMEFCDFLFGIVSCIDVLFNVRSFAEFDSVYITLKVDEEGNLRGGQFIRRTPVLFIYHKRIAGEIEII